MSAHFDEIREALAETLERTPLWVVAHRSDRCLIENLDGVEWWDAPAPRRFHRHWVQTRGWTDTPLNYVERCPCGATKLDDHWVKERRQSRRVRGRER